MIIAFQIWSYYTSHTHTERYAAGSKGVYSTHCHYNMGNLLDKPEVLHLNKHVSYEKRGPACWVDWWNNDRVSTVGISCWTKQHSEMRCKIMYIEFSFAAHSENRTLQRVQSPFALAGGFNTLRRHLGDISPMTTSVSPSIWWWTSSLLQVFQKALRFHFGPSDWRSLACTAAFLFIG